MWRHATHLLVLRLGLLEVVPLLQLIGVGIGGFELGAGVTCLSATATFS